MALRRTMLNGGGGFGDRYAYPYRPIYRAPIVTNKITPLEPVKIPIKINHGLSLYLGWDDPEPIYCMKPNPNIQTILPLACKPNKAAIAEMAANFKPLPSGDVVIQAENGNGETVEIAVNGNGEVIAERPAPNIMPLVLAAGAALFFLM